MSRRRKDRRARGDGERASPEKPATPVARGDSLRDKQVVGVCFALGALIALVYSNSFSASLVLDNRPLIAADPRIQTWDLEGLKYIFVRDYWWPQRASDLYRPLTTLSYWFNYTVLGNGVGVWGYHVVNFLLHWANACLVLLIVRRLSGRMAVGVFAAALFAVHPVQTESVTNIVGRADLLATLFVLFGGWCYLRGTGNREQGTATWMAMAGASAFAAVFAKETGILIVAFVLLYDWIWRWPTLATGSWRVRLRPYVAFVPAVVAFVVARMLVAYHSLLPAQVFVDNPIAHADWFAGFMTAWKVLGRYVALLVWPRVLSSDYSYNQIPVHGTGGAWENTQAYLAFALVAGIVAYAVWLRRRQPMIAWGILFLFVMLLPTSNLLVPIGSIMGERFLYLPSIGVCAAVACFLLTAVSQLPAAPPRLAVFVAVAVVFALGIRAFVRNNDWRDEMSLWTSTVQAAPASFRAHTGYSNALLTYDQTEPTIDSAIAVAERALSILERPPLPIDRIEPGLLLNLGVDYRIKAVRLRARGETDESTVFLQKSVAVLKRAAEADRAFSDASRAARLRRGHRADDIPDIGNAAIYVSLGEAHRDLRDWNAALEPVRYAQRIAPDMPRAYAVEGAALYYSQQPAAAAVPFTISLLLDGNDSAVWKDLLACYQMLGQPAPVLERSGYYRIDTDNPAGKDLLERAGARLVANFEAAKRHADAEFMREDLNREFGIQIRD